MIGKIVWYSKRDQNGIILCPQGNEYYFDSSVTEMAIDDIKRHQIVEFTVNRAIKDARCARDVAPIDPETWQKLLSNLQRIA